ncbi:MAG: carboxy terminal-processing peptidase, partial [Bacteroidota bacterium]
WQKYEAEARTQAARIARQQIRKWKVEKEDFEKKLSDIYLNSLASAFDPHSAYFASEDKESFLSNLSTSAFSYGFYVKESDEGSMLVSILTPGGPAWRSGEIHSGDKVISIQKEGKTETDFSSLGIEEVYEQLMPGNEKYMDVTLISSNDIKKTIRLKKEKLKVEENILQGYLLEGSRKAGYIALPDFFVQEGSNWMLGCANEVAKEILKLKKENIEGIILDLRYNGGGSLKEAIDLAGLFINEGPMMMSTERNQKPHLIKDLNRGTLYDGPLVIMINNYTASAAEVLSMILKDYNRAVIIGTQSYGKATGQNISPLDLSIDPVAYKTDPQNKSLTKFVKITNATLFSVKGVTYQKKGITPDIVLLDINNTQQSYESQYPNALSPDSLNKKLLYTPCPNLPLKELAENSNKRVEQSWRFRRVKEISDSLQKAGKIKTVPIEWKSFTKWNKNADEVMDQIDSLLNNKEASFKVNNNRFAQDLISVDDYLKEIIDAEIKNIRNDIYIEEAYKTLIDLIQITTKK